jgi:hypothetical protein
MTSANFHTDLAGLRYEGRKGFLFAHLEAVFARI